MRECLKKKKKKKNIRLKPLDRKIKQPRNIQI